LTRTTLRAFHSAFTSRARNVSVERNNSCVDDLSMHRASKQPEADPDDE
jgi:hypothetical protein